MASSGVSLRLDFYLAVISVIFSVDGGSEMAQKENC